MLKQQSQMINNLTPLSQPYFRPNSKSKHQLRNNYVSVIVKTPVYRYYNQIDLGKISTYSRINHTKTEPSQKINIVNQNQENSKNWQKSLQKYITAKKSVAQSKKISLINFNFLKLNRKNQVERKRLLEQYSLETRSETLEVQRRERQKQSSQKDAKETNFNRVPTNNSFSKRSSSINHSFHSHDQLKKSFNKTSRQRERSILKNFLSTYFNNKQKYMKTQTFIPRGTIFSKKMINTNRFQILKIVH